MPIRSGRENPGQRKPMARNRTGRKEKGNMKREKYIQETRNASGNKIIRIDIDLYGQRYRATINPKNFDSYKQALDFAKEERNRKLVEMQQGYTVTNFRAVGEIYAESKKLFPARLKTVQRHDHFYNKGIKQYESVSIEKITSADIQKSVNEYAATHTREQSKHFLSVWRLIYKTAVMMNISIPDRTIPVKLPDECKQDQPRKKEVSAEDLEQFLDTLQLYNARTETGLYQSQCLYYAIQVMRYCGLRPAETFALTKNDIFLNSSGTGFIQVNKAARSTNKSMLEISGTKTQKSNRLVPIPAALGEILRECLQWSKHELIFADYHGNLQSIDKVSDTVRLVARKAGVKFNLYMLRHQLSTDLFNSGTAPNVIRDIMGHESANMSLDYAVSSEKDRITALDRRKMN